MKTLERALSTAGYSPEAAQILAHNCVQIQHDGSESHGLFRVKDYVSTVKSGYLNPAPTPRVEDVAPGFLRVPDGTGINGGGKPTNDPSAILNGGALSTFGGHKGASISLVVEILCAALVGADFSYEVNWTGLPGAITARTAETIIVIDPRKGAAALPSLAARVEELVAELVAAGQGRIPGDRRLQAREKSEGFVTMSDKEWRPLEALASNQG